MSGADTDAAFAIQFVMQAGSCRLAVTSALAQATQNYFCPAQAAAFLTGLAITASCPGGWWLDPVIGLGIAAAAVGRHPVLARRRLLRLLTCPPGKYVAAVEDS